MHSLPLTRRTARTRPRRRTRLLVLALLLAALPALPSLAAAQPALPVAPDALPLLPPLTPSGVLHSLGGAMSGLIAASIAAAAYPAATVQSYPLLLPALGATAALAAGIAKETLDATGFGGAQWNDIMHTLIGGAAGAAFIAVGELAFAGQPAQRRNEAALFGSVGVALAVPVAAGFLGEIELYIQKRRSRK